MNNFLICKVPKLVKNKAWLSSVNSLKPGQLICLVLDEEIRLAEKCSVFFDSVSDLVPQNLIIEKDLFSQERIIEQYFCKCMEGSFA